MGEILPVRSTGMLHVDDRGQNGVVFHGPMSDFLHVRSTWMLPVHDRGQGGGLLMYS